MIGHEIDETCGRDGCDGVMEPSKEPPDGCYCHASPPCELCVNDPARCSKCNAVGGTEPDASAEPTAPAAPPDVIAIQMGPEVTAWIADVLRQWSEAVEQVEELRWTADNNAVQVGTLASELTAARKRLAEVANHVDQFVLASVKGELAQSRMTLVDTRTECEQWKLLAKNYENERDAATKRAQIAEGELTKTRRLYTEAANLAETALAQVAMLKSVVASATTNPLTLWETVGAGDLMVRGAGPGEAIVVVKVGIGEHQAVVAKAIERLARAI